MVKGEHHPEAGFDEVCHFISEEFPEEVGRGVGPPVGVALYGDVTPWWVVHGHTHTMVAELSEVVTRRVRNVVEVWCEV